MEHPDHIRHLRGVEVFQPFDAFKGLEVLKPSCCGGGAEITKRSVKYSSKNGCIGRVRITSPSGIRFIIDFSRFLYSPRCAVAFSTEGVVIESEDGFICIEMHVGFGSGGHRANGFA